MDVFNKIIRDSAIGNTSTLYKSLVILLFATIVAALLVMLVLLFLNATHTSISFGYLYTI